MMAVKIIKILIIIREICSVRLFYYCIHWNTLTLHMYLGYIIPLHWRY